MAKRIKKETILTNIRYQYDSEISEVNKKIIEAEQKRNIEEVNKLKDHIKVLRDMMIVEIALAGGPRPLDW